MTLISGRPLLVAVDQRGVGHGTAEIQEDPHVAYLVVESANIEWAFKLEAAVGGMVESSRKVVIEFGGPASPYLGVRSV